MIVPRQQRGGIDKPQQLVGGAADRQRRLKGLAALGALLLFVLVCTAPPRRAPPRGQPGPARPSLPRPLFMRAEDERPLREGASVTKSEAAAVLDSGGTGGDGDGDAAAAAAASKDSSSSSITSSSSTSDSTSNDSSTEKPAADDVIVHSVVIDAGSTGSRVSAYRFRRAKAGPPGAWRLDNATFAAVKPGLSAYAGAPRKAAESLKPLLDAAVKAVPAADAPRTAVTLKATAGLRLLPGGEAAAILREVEAYLREATRFNVTSVGIMDGAHEGAYAWLTLNYLLGRLGGGPDGTVAAIDLGGGSVQEAFALADAAAADAPEGYVTKLNANGREWRVYVHSYLGYGLMAARAKVLEAAAAAKAKPAPSKRARAAASAGGGEDGEGEDGDEGEDGGAPGAAKGPDEEDDPNDPEHDADDDADGAQQVTPAPPCFAAPARGEGGNGGSSGSGIVEYTYAGKRYAVAPAPGDTADFERCAAAALAAMKHDHSSGCARPGGCSFAGGWRGRAPARGRAYYVSSFFFDRAVESGIIADAGANEWRTTPGEFAARAAAVCGRKPGDVARSYRVPPAAAPFFCLDLAYCHTVLKEGFDLADDAPLTLVKRVAHNGQLIEASWPLGAALAALPQTAPA